MSIYKGMLEASVFTIDDNGEPVIPYYNKDRLNFYMEDYLEKNLKRFVNDYALNITYLDEEFLPTNDENSRTASINLQAKINIFFDYDKTLTFTVMSRNEL